MKCLWRKGQATWIAGEKREDNIESLEEVLWRGGTSVALLVG